MDRHLRFLGIGLLSATCIVLTLSPLRAEDEPTEETAPSSPAPVKEKNDLQTQDKILESFETAIAEKPATPSSSPAVVAPLTPAPAAPKANNKKRDELPIEPGDRLKVKIYPEDDYVKGGEVPVSTEGNITLALIGKVNVAGKLTSQAEQMIAKIVDADYLVNPEVVIEVIKRSEGAKQTVIVFGQVRKPGPYDIPPDKKHFTLLEAISQAGGFTEIANIKKIKVVHNHAGQKSVVHVNGEDVMSGQAEDIDLEPGDVITVSESVF